MKNQSELIKRMPREELRKQLMFSQGLFFFLSIVCSIFLFDRLSDWFRFFYIDWHAILLYGIATPLIIVAIEVILYVTLPPSMFDDGGINEKIFKNESVGWIAMIALVVAISEEMLFRGIIQSAFGYIFASSLFALIHIRYLKKPLLFICVLIVSFVIGYIFLITENLLITIMFHFLMDFLLGMFIKVKK